MSLTVNHPSANYPWATGRRDLVAGLTVAAVALPQGVAYALIAGVDPKYGVYSAIVVTAIASIFGSSAHLINGPTSAISLLVFSSLAFIDPENRTALFEALFLTERAVGVFQILIAVFKLGDLTRYISESVIIGFMLAAALLLAIGQIGKRHRREGQGNAHMQVLQRLYLTLFHGDKINFRAVLLSVTAVVVAVVGRRLVKRFGWPQIDLLLVLVVAGLIAYAAGWSIPVRTASRRCRSRRRFRRACQHRTSPFSISARSPSFHRARWRIAFIASSRRCRSPRRSRISPSRRSTTTARSWPRALPTSPAASSRRCRVRFTVAVGDQLPGRCGDPLLRHRRRGDGCGGTPAVCPLAALRADGCAGGLAARHRRTVGRLQAADRHREGLALRAGLVVNHRAHRDPVDLDKAVLLGIALSVVLFVPRAAKLKAAELAITPEVVVRERLPRRSVDPST